MPLSRRKVIAGGIASGIATGLTPILLGANYSMASTKLTNAKLFGFRAPEESSPHERTFMQWPSSIHVYGYSEDLRAAQGKIALIANAISKFEPVVMLADGKIHDRLRSHLGENIELWDVPTEDLWCRDSGPVFVNNSKGELAASNLNFNGWGRKQIHGKDGKVVEQIAEKMDLAVFNNGVVGEPGGIEFDGEGTLIAHESSWVNPNRNSGLRDEVESLLLQAYGAEKVIWAKGVYGEDITDYHIDALARFTEPGIVLMQLPDAIIPGDPWSKAAYETYEVLKNATDHEGRKLEIVVIPDPVNIRSNNRDFVASYVNYYVCNDAVISSEFGDDKVDEIASNTLKELYPEREIISLNTDAIGEFGGGIHCATQQQPKSTGLWKSRWNG